MTGGSHALAAEARKAADAVAARAGLRLVELTDVPAQSAAAALLGRIWKAGAVSQPIDVALLRALEFVGGYVAGAYRGAELVGAAVAFFAADGHLHSHVVGVAPEHHDRAVGSALKLHQRAWALARGVTVVSWTFDPLVRRNAFFNITKLGAVPAAYLVDFYGEMSDAINAGAGSDRLLVEWRLDGARAVEAAAGRRCGPDADRLRATARVRLGRSPTGAPVVPGGSLPDGSVWLVAVPEDVEALRRSDPALAARWRAAVREALQEGMADGRRVTGATRGGWYVLEADS
ncbi:GNAT family N-acetyltransferase [Streptoalloteichus hindustanus]|uniref:Predicted acetyltransferase, GNAT superfamily n=1 Tax=Streptoalloteichus hindustanus TaxID=2017 RepID=A0A1M4XKF3_STRHI|nr:GNAT family N-acetyltransferase [Streptoalloteichus hindustanus]SHE93753.1 Predicted acetyltransferase, GNAT superfamily [Streptoalloteichus hindustanus]